MGTDNGWIGYTYGKDYGYMKFFQKDGKDYVTVHRAGAAEDETGEITIDEKKKTIDMGEIKVLCAETWVGGTAGVRNVLSLTDEGLQIGIVSGDDYQYSLNYYSQAKADKDAKINVQLNACGTDWAGKWNAVVDEIDPENLEGTHTFKFNGSCPDGMVNTIDFIGLAKRFPNAFVRIDDIKLDGQSIKFDANNFFYGDIENNGAYRVELFNIYGKGAEDNGNKVKKSAFSNSQNVGSEPALKFTNSMEVTYTVFINGPAGTYTPGLISINPSWGGTSWDGLSNGSFELKLNPETAKYEISQNKFDITLNDASFGSGPIMAFVQIAHMHDFFPGLHATLDELYLDGKAKTFDKAKVIDAVDGSSYRLELWNTFGATKEAGCAFGSPNGDAMPGLAFNKSMQVKFTIHSLFAVPEW